MCAQRILRSGLPSDTISGRPMPRDDERQGVLDLRVLPTYRAYSATRGWGDKVDEVQLLASAFADRLSDVTSIRSLGELDDTDAAKVNANIASIARAADDLISAVVSNAESRGLQATGPWMDIPLFECREFEIEERDPIGEQADDAYGQMKK